MVDWMVWRVRVGVVAQAIICHTWNKTTVGALMVPIIVVGMHIILTRR